MLRTRPSTPAARGIGELRLKRSNDLGVELSAGVAQQLLDRRVRRHGAPVRTVRRHRVEGVADGHDSSTERYLLADQAVSIRRPGEQ